MSGLITTGSFSTTLRPGINTFFGMEYDRQTGQYEKIFDVRTSDKRYEEDVMLQGFGLATVMNEGDSVTYGSAKQDWTKRFVHVMYGQGFVISKLAQDDNQYAMNLAMMLTKNLAMTMLVTKETIAASVLNNAFSAGGNGQGVGGDGAALCSTSHPNLGGTYSNKLAVDTDLSEAAIEQACIDIRGLTDDAGVLIGLKPNKLVIHRNDMFNATRILKGSERPDTANRDVNALNYMGIINEVVINDYLTDSDAWFITTNCPNGLIHYKRKGYELTSDNDFDTGNAKFKVTERYSFNFSDPKGIYGSQGA